MLDFLLGLFKGARKVDFGKVDPDNVESYWRVDHEVDQAERAGPAQLAQVLAKWGLRDKAHWEQVQGELAQRHGSNPEFQMAAARVQLEVQTASMAQHYQMPPEYATPPHGITLDRYAAIRAQLDLGYAPGPVLAQHHLDAARWDEVDRTWTWRMGPQADALAAQILSSTYHGMRMQALASYRRS